MFKQKLLQHQVIKNGLALVVVQVANYIVPLLAWPLLTKALGLEIFGILMMLFAVCSVCYIFTDFGFNLSATHFIAQNTGEKELIGQLLGDVFFIKFFLATITSFLATLYIIFHIIPTYPQVSGVTVILVCLVIFAQAFHSIWFFQGIEKMKHITKANIFAKVVYIIILLISLQISQSLNLAIFCFFVSQFLLTLLYLFFIKKEGYFFLIPRVESIVKELKHSFSFFISRIAVSIFTTVNVLILGFFSGSAAVVGLYSSAEKIYAAANSMLSVVTQALFPFVTKQKRVLLLYRVAIVLFILTSIGSYIVSLFSEELVVFLFGESFRGAATLLDIFLIILCFSSVSMLFGYPAFATINKIYWANYTVMIGAVLQLGLVAILILLNEVSAKNLLYSALLTEVMIFTLRLLLVKKFSMEGKVSD